MIYSKLDTPPWIVMAKASDEQLYFDDEFKEFTRRQIISFQTQLLKLRFKYQIWMDYYKEEYLNNTEAYLKSYAKCLRETMQKENSVKFEFRTLYRNELFRLPAVTHIYYLEKNQSLLNGDFIDLYDYKRYLTDEEKKVIYFIKHPIFQFEALSGYFQSNIDKSGILDKEYNIYFQFGVMSNIFYPRIETSQMERSESGKTIFDNSLASLYNASRYNSFLRELKDIVQSLGWRMSFRKEYANDRYFENENGIFINERIIYREDLGEI